MGLPLAIRFIESGFKVLGLDKDKEKIKKIKLGQSYISTIDSSEIEKCQKLGFEVTNDSSKTEKIDVFIICVPTPLNKYRDPDLSYVVDSIKSIKPYLKEGSLVSLESTTYPGTTEELVLPLLTEKSKFVVGENIFLAYSPEREDPGNLDFKSNTIPKIVSGVTNNCLQVAQRLYSEIIKEIVPVSSTRAAEMTKLLENIYRAVNIGLVNELKTITDQMDIDIHEVIEAAATKPFGFSKFSPGPGLGGHCIPVDPFYLSWKAKEFGFNSGLIELAGEINRNMPNWVISKIGDALNSLSLSIKDSKILILGVSYKKNINDLRESPAIEIINKLSEKGASIKYSDPFCNEVIKTQKGLELENVTLNEKVLKEFDLVVLITDHDSFDFNLIKENSNYLVDTRGVYLEYSDKIMKA